MSNTTLIPSLGISNVRVREKKRKKTYYRVANRIRLKNEQHSLLRGRKKRVLNLLVGFLFIENDIQFCLSREILLPEFVHGLNFTA